jgi:hypothetical protein
MLLAALLLVGLCLLRFEVVTRGLDLFDVFVGFLLLLLHSSVVLGEETISVRVSKEDLFEQDDSGGVGNGCEPIRIDVLVIFNPIDLR